MPDGIGTLNHFGFGWLGIDKLSKDYLKCLGGKVKKKTSGFGLDTNNIKEKKYLTDWFKKKEKWVLKKA